MARIEADFVGKSIVGNEWKRVYLVDLNGLLRLVEAAAQRTKGRPRQLTSLLDDAKVFLPAEKFVVQTILEVGRENQMRTTTRITKNEKKTRAQSKESTADGKLNFYFAQPFLCKSNAEDLDAIQRLRTEALMASSVLANLLAPICVASMYEPAGAATL